MERDTSRLSNVERLRRAIIKQSHVEYNELSPGAQRIIDRVSGRSRKIVRKFDAKVRPLAPPGRSHMKRMLVGGASSVTNWLDGQLPKEKRKPSQRKQVNRKKSKKGRKRVVGRK